MQRQHTNHAPNGRNCRTRPFLCGLLFMLFTTSTSIAKDNALKTPALDIVPADVNGFLFVPDLASLEREVMTLARDLDLPVGPQSMISSPISAVQHQLALDAKPQPSGALGIVFPGIGERSSLLTQLSTYAILLPREDARFFGEDIQAELRDGPVMHSVEDRILHLATKRTTLIISKHAAVVKKLLDHEGQLLIDKIASERSGPVTRQDAFIWIRGETVARMVRSMQSFLKAGGQSGFSSYQINLIDTFLLMGHLPSAETLEDVTCGLEVDSNTGLRLAVAAHARDGVTKHSPSPGQPATSLLLGVPEKGVITASAGIIPNVKFESLQDFVSDDLQFRRMLSFMFEEAFDNPLLTEEERQILTTKAETLWSNINRINTSEVLLPKESKHGYLSHATVLTLEDGEQCLAQIRELGSALKPGADRLISHLRSDSETKGEPVDVYQFKAAAESLEGHPVDLLTVHPKRLTEESGFFADMFTDMLGNKSIELRMGRIGEQHVLVTVGGGKAHYGRLARLITKGRSPYAESAGYAKSSHSLPEKLIYMAMFEVAQMPVLLARQAESMGGTMDDSNVPNAPPFIMAAATSDEGRTLEGHLVLPIKTLQAVKQSFFGGVAVDQAKPRKRQVAPSAPPEE